MILADKIIKLRKQNNWSQEELAERVGVSRQAVSKWEGAQSVPDLQKVIQLSNLFNVSTDYLLKDGFENEKTAENIEDMKSVTLSDAQEFLKQRNTASVKIAVGTMLCVFAIVPLVFFAALYENGNIGMSEDMAGMVGLAIGLVMVAVAVGLFLSSGFKNAPFEFIEKEPFHAEYGVTGMVEEKKKNFRSTYIRLNTIAVIMCILAILPVVVSETLFGESMAEFMVCVMFIIVGIAVGMFVFAGVRQSAMDKLLQEGDYSKRNKKSCTEMTVYWLVVLVIFILVSRLIGFGTSWVVWVAGGILSSNVRNFILDKKEKKDRE